MNALADATRRVAALEPSPAAKEHAAEEEAHIALWAEFADAVGAAPSAPLPETSRCAGAWADRERALLPTLVALYAIESAQPAIADAKRAGLVEHYGFAPGAPTAYFDLHSELDVEHARAGRAEIAARRSESTHDDDELVREAERALTANWELLDGVEAVCAGVAGAA